MKVADLDTTKKYTDALKKQIKLADGDGVPFYHFNGWEFPDGDVTELVVVGDFPQVAAKAKKKCGTAKVIGLCKFEDGKLNIKVVKGRLEEQKVGKAFKDLKVMFPPKEVDGFAARDEVAEASRAKTMADVDETAKAAELVTGTKLKETIAALETLTTARAAGLRWQKLEMATMLKAQDKLDQLKQKYDADVAKLDAAIAANKVKRTDLKDTISRTRSDKDLRQQTKDHQIKRLEKALAKLEVETGKAEKARQALEDKYGVGKQFDFARIDASKHGTGRHGAQAGIEQQARRAATGGMTADQADAPSGDTSGHSEITAQNGGTWQGIALVWEDVTDQNGTVTGRKLRDDVEAAVKKKVRWCDTRTSSNFLGPELEMEAAKRALKIANQQVIWDEVRDGPDDEWEPLTRIMLQIGPPVLNKTFKGWGMSATGSGAPKSIGEALDAVDKFTKGKMDLNALLNKLNVTMDERDGGAIIMPNAQIMLDRKGKKWVNTSQYPINAPAGWNIQGKLVRKTGDKGTGIRAPSLSGL